jgi:hypothetical protein
MWLQTDTKDKSTGGNMRLASCGVTCLFDTFVVKQTVVHLINFCGKIPHERQAQKRYASFSSFNYFGFF